MTILIVDDVPADLDLLKTILAEAVLECRGCKIHG
jgi:hypothetical protein